MSGGKQMTGWLVEMALGGLLLCVCLSLLWGGHGESLLRMGSERLMASGENGIGLEGLGIRLEEIMAHQPPELKVEFLPAKTGETVLLWQRLQVKDESAQWTALAQQGEVTGKILGFYDDQGKKITSVQWQDDNAWEEIPSLAAYDLIEGKMIFFRGGSYRVAVRLTNSYGRRTEALVTFLVEAV